MLVTQLILKCDTKLACMYLRKKTNAGEKNMEGIEPKMWKTLHTNNIKSPSILIFKRNLKGFLWSKTLRGKSSMTSPVTGHFGLFETVIFCLDSCFIFYSLNNTVWCSSDVSFVKINGLFLSQIFLFSNFLYTCEQ